MTNTIDNDDVSMSIDMVEMGVRPSNWIEEKAQWFESTAFLGKQYPYHVYPAEYPSVTTNDLKDVRRKSSDEDEEDANDYEIDPETGEKIYREKSTITTIFSPTNKWIDEYISNLETASLPVTTDETIVSNIPSNLFQNSDPQWFNEYFPLDENSQTNLFNEIFPSDDDQQTNSQSASMEMHSTTNEYPMNDDSQASFISTTKLEKIDPQDSNSPQISSRRSHSHPRSHSQTQQDEEILLQYQIPLTVEQITQSTTEEYNQYLARLVHLTAEQIHIIKDMRRRGKNKIAAQNCRKRKAIGVEALAEEVDELKRIKNELEEQKKAYEKEIAETRRQYEYLHRQVLPHRQLPPTIRVK